MYHKVAGFTPATCSDLASAEAKPTMVATIHVKPNTKPMLAATKPVRLVAKPAAKPVQKPLRLAAKTLSKSLVKPIRLVAKVIHKPIAKPNRIAAKTVKSIKPGSKPPVTTTIPS
jgi:hypothetical protein